jgi:hypothetical protein
MVCFRNISVNTLHKGGGDDKRCTDSPKIATSKFSMPEE